MRLAPRPSVLRTHALCRRPFLATGLLAAALATHASAAAAGALTGGPDSRAAGARVARAPVAQKVLPSSIAHGQRLAAAPTPRWLIGVDGDRAEARRVARAAGGTFDPKLDLVSVPRSAAGTAAAALGSAVTWAGPDVVASRASSFDDRGGVVSPWSRSVGAPPSLTPAPGTLATIGIVDDAVDRSVAELKATRLVNRQRTVEPHGTMVASTAAAPYDGRGVVGVAPGAGLLSWGTSSLYCTDVSSGIIRLVDRGAKVVNVSLSFDYSCFALWQAIAYANAKHVSVVVASGNDGDRGNRLSYPASFPHVITAGAVDRDLVVPLFSNFNEFVDIAAPGVDIPVDTPLRFDTDKTVDGRAVVSGTSFAAPYVSGGISWILGARPELDPHQVATVLRAGVRDIETPGWDARSGFGLLQITASMAAPTPPRDVQEPNDDPAFVKGSGSGTFAKRPLWTGSATPRTIVAEGDSADDPIDAYRVKIPGRSKVTVTLTPSAGLVDLFAFDGKVGDFAGAPLDASTQKGLAVDTVTLRNTGRASRIAYVVANSIAEGTRTLSRYELTIQRG